MKEVVLGGEGLIGSELVRELKQRGHQVTSLDLQSGCDLRDGVDLRLLEGCDRIWFLAWDTGGAKFLEAEDRQHEQYKNNCLLSLNIFEALAQTRKPFLFTTSQLAGLPNAYGTTKLLAWHWAKHLGGKVARLWNVYGWEHPDQRSHVVTDLVLSGLQGEVRCLTSGEERRLFLYKTDAVAALIKLFDSPLQTAEIAGGNWVQIKDVANEIARQLGVKVRVGSAKGSEVPIDPTELLPDWRPKVDLADGLAMVIKEARADLALVAQP